MYSVKVYYSKYHFNFYYYTLIFCTAQPQGRQVTTGLHNHPIGYGSYWEATCNTTTCSLTGTCTTTLPTTGLTGSGVPFSVSIPIPASAVQTSNPPRMKALAARWQVRGVAGGRPRRQKIHLRDYGGNGGDRAHLRSRERERERSRPRSPRSPPPSYLRPPSPRSAPP